MSLKLQKTAMRSNTFAVAKGREPQATVNAALNPIEAIVTETEVVLQPIYFDFDKHNITQAAATELDKLVQVMKSNDKLIILAKSHTDYRGSDAYNLALSDRRAKATVQYIISKGISAKRITAKDTEEPNQR
jgi:outer membrane protein OmpA-like peptidoglycan-associated protein